MSHNTLHDRLEDLNNQNDIIVATDQEIIDSHAALQENNTSYAMLANDFYTDIEALKLVGTELIERTEGMIDYIQQFNAEAVEFSARIDNMKTIMQR